VLDRGGANQPISGVGGWVLKKEKLYRWKNIENKFSSGENRIAKTTDRAFQQKGKNVGETCFRREKGNENLFKAGLWLPESGRISATKKLSMNAQCKGSC